MQSELEKVAWFQYFALLLIKKKTKFCKQQKIGGFEYFGDSDVVNKLNDEHIMPNNMIPFAIQLFLSYAVLFSELFENRTF